MDRPYLALDQLGRYWNSRGRPGLAREAACHRTVFTNGTDDTTRGECEKGKETGTGCETLTSSR